MQGDLLGVHFSDRSEQALNHALVIDPVDDISITRDLSVDFAASVAHEGAPFSQAGAPLVFSAADAWARPRVGDKGQAKQARFGSQSQKTKTGQCDFQ